MSCLGFLYGFPQSVQEHAQAVPNLDQNLVLPDSFPFIFQLHLSIGRVIGDNPQLRKVNPIKMFMTYFGRKIELVPTLKGNYRPKAYNIEELSVTRIIISGPISYNPFYSGQREICGGGFGHSRMRRSVCNVGDTDLAIRLTVSEDPNPQHTAVETYNLASF